MERLKLEKVYAKISKEDKPIFFSFWCINMAAVLKIRKLIVIIIIMVIIIIIIIIIFT